MYSLLLIATGAGKDDTVQTRKNATRDILVTVSPSGFQKKQSEYEPKKTIFPPKEVPRSLGCFPEVTSQTTGLGIIIVRSSKLDF